MSLRTRLALATLSTFNALVLALLGAVWLRFADGTAAPIGAALLWSGTVTLVVISRRLRRPVEWR